MGSLCASWTTSGFLLSVLVRSWPVFIARPCTTSSGSSSKLNCNFIRTRILILAPFCPGICFWSSYTAALGVTVGVGCLLLLLNMLIFAGIYYQRDRSRRKNRLARRSSHEKSSTTSSGSLGGHSTEGGRHVNPGDSSGRYTF